METTHGLEPPVELHPDTAEMRSRLLSVIGHLGYTTLVPGELPPGISRVIGDPEEQNPERDGWSSFIDKPAKPKTT